MLPRCITAVRSLTCRTTATLCETKIIDSPRDSFRSNSRLITVACSETSNADTGSSAMSTLGLHGQRPLDPDPLPLSTGELTGGLPQRAGRQPDHAGSRLRGDHRKADAIDAPRCQRILDTVERTGRDVTVTFNYRYNPVHEKVRELLADGAVGEIGSVHFEWLLDVRHGADYFRRWHRD